MLPLAIAFLAAACATGAGGGSASVTPVTPADGALTVRAFEWGFEPRAIALRRGEQVRIVLHNQGTILHNWKVGGLEAEVVESRSSGPLSGDQGELFVGADDGQQGTITFVPEGPGTFEFYCTIRGHRRLGMEGTLTIE